MPYNWYIEMDRYKKEGLYYEFKTLQGYCFERIKEY